MRLRSNRRLCCRSTNITSTLSRFIESMDFGLRAFVASCRTFRGFFLLGEIPSSVVVVVMQRKHFFKTVARRVNTVALEQMPLDGLNRRVPTAIYIPSRAAYSADRFSCCLDSPRERQKEPDFDTCYEIRKAGSSVHLRNS